MATLRKILPILVLAGAASVGHAAPGDIDPSFGAGGVTSTPAGSSWSMASAIARQADGRLVVTGTHFSDTSFADAEFAVARYLPNGTLDTSFGESGIANTPIGVPTTCCDILYTEATSVAIQADGKILVAGQTYVDGTPTYDPGLVRYDPSGALDPTFGASGKVVDPIGSSFEALAVQTDGRILAAGTGILTRFEADGSRDPTFGTGGIASTADIRDMVLLPGGDIITVGASDTYEVSDIQLMKFDSTGTLDPTFGIGGVTTTDFGASEVGRAVSLAPDGGIIVAGGALSLDLLENAIGYLVRYDASGSWDATFGGTGSPATGPLLDVVTLADGRIVVAGSMLYDFFGFPIPTSFLLAGYLADGSPDPAFSAAVSIDSAAALLALPSSKVIVAGHMGSIVEPMTFGVARHLIDGVPDPPCGNGTVEEDEECDDGNTRNGDCCSSSCESSPAGTICGEATSCSAASSCDGAGACLAGGPNPSSGCKVSTVPFQDKLVVNDHASDAKDGLTWLWRRGEQTLPSELGDPTATDDYTACLFSGGQAYEIDIPGGTTCNGKPCWRTTSKGFKYKSKDRAPDGIKTLRLKAGTDGKGTVVMKGKGELLPIPSLPLALPATLQLRNDEGSCWQSTFDAVGATKNTATQFVGRSTGP